MSTFEAQDRKKTTVYLLTNGKRHGLTHDVIHDGLRFSEIAEIILKRIHPLKLQQYHTQTQSNE